MTKLSYEEWEKWFIETECVLTEEDIEIWKTRYRDTYEELSHLLQHEYKLYCGYPQ